MHTIYHLNADELDSKFLDNLKSMFSHKQIEIAVSEADETDYLLRAPANRAQLLQAVADVDTARNLVIPDQTAFR